MMLERDREGRPARGGTDGLESYSRQIPFGGRGNRWPNCLANACEVPSIAARKRQEIIITLRAAGISTAVFGFGQRSLFPDGADVGKTLQATGNSVLSVNWMLIQTERKVLLKKAAVVWLEGVGWVRLLEICDMRCGN